MNRFVAVYTRVSTGIQASEGTSLEGQAEICGNKAYKLGASASDIKLYKEEGFTGEDIDRPALNLLMQDVKNKKIKILIVTHPDRLTRDLTDKLIICKELEKQDVELVFVDTEYKNTAEGQLFFNMMSSIAQYELQLIKKRTVRGRIRAVEKENKVMPMRVAPYGFDLINSKLYINEKESYFVRLIYQWYVYGDKTMKQIGNELVLLGAIPKRAESKNWSASSIAKILTSEIYIGKYYYNRRQTTKIRGQKTASGNTKKTYTIRDKEEWIMINVPSIIDEGLFELAQKQRNKNLTRKGGNVKHTYMLKSLIKCGHCGKTWEATSYQSKKNGEKIYYPIYRCSGKYPKKYGESVHKCKTPTIRVDIIDNFIWEMIKELINKPETVIERLSIDSETPKKNLIELLSGYEEQLNVKENERNRIKLMFRKGIIDEDELEDDINSLNKEIEKVKNEFNQINDKITALNRAKLSEERLHELTQVYSKLINTDLPDEDKKFILDKLIDHIIISYDADNELFSVSCTGYLGSHLYGNIDSSFNLLLETQPQEIR